MGLGLRKSIAVVIVVLILVAQLVFINVNSYAYAGENGYTMDGPKSIKSKIKDASNNEFEAPSLSIKTMSNFQKTNNTVIPDINSLIVPGKINVKYKNGLESSKKNYISSRFSASSFNTDNELGLTQIGLPEGADIMSAINELKKDPDVEYAEPVYKYNIDYIESSNISVAQAVYNVNDPRYLSNEQWGLSKINIAEAWDKTKNNIDDRKNTIMAIVDSGVDYDHEDLAASMIQGKKFLNLSDSGLNGAENLSADNLADTNDDNGHGTHVAGIAAALDDNGKGIAGVAGYVKIMPVKVLDNHGAGTSNDMIAGIKWAANHGANVINLSFGRPSHTVANGKVVDTGLQAEYDAIQYAISKGTVVFAAAGNEGDTSMDYPANYNNVFAVGAIDSSEAIASFSNTGPGLNAVAPGVDILSTYNDGGYTLKSGTSMASPFVSGLAALMKSADKSLTYGDIYAILTSGARDKGNYNSYGAGIINATIPFNSPRLSMKTNINNSTSPSQITVTMDVYDYCGSRITSATGNININLTVEKYDFTQLYGQSKWVPDPTLNNTIINVVNGTGNVTKDLPDYGVFDIYATKNGYTDSKKVLISSLPAVPTASLAPGSYTGVQYVSLSTTTPGADIYYTLDGVTYPNSSSYHYTGPITLSSSTTIIALSVKNGAPSSTNTFAYTITIPPPPPSGGGGGGGGSAPPPPPPPPKNQDPEAGPQPGATIDTGLLNNDLNRQDIKDVSIAIPANSSSQSAAIDLSVLDKLVEKDKRLTIKSDGVDITIPPSAIISSDVIEKEGNKSKVKIAVEATKRVDIEGKLKEMGATDGNGLYAVGSKVYEFKSEIITEKNKTASAITSFKKPVTITISLKSENLDGIDADKLGVYYFNETSKKWEYVGGKYDPANKTITFSTPHFSMYSVMRSESKPTEKPVEKPAEKQTKTFDDIADHWAKAEIEKMAAKGIANGVDGNNFAPNASISRAGFAALLSRALNLKTSETGNKFSDVPDGSWYKESVNKAYAANIISGISSDKFAPDDKITREQMASMIMRAYAFVSGKKLDDLVTSQEIRFKDEGAASSWARRNIILANATGLMSGNPDGTFSPKDNATRAQAIVILSRLMEKLGL